VIVCVGDMMVDVFTEPDGAWRAHPGGKVCNYTAMARALGSASAAIGCLGADDAGRTLLAALGRLDVDTSGVMVHPSAPTGADFFEGGGWRMERGANWFLTPTHVRAALGALRASGGISAMIVNQGVAAPASEAAVQFAREHDIFLILNLAPQAVERGRRIDPACYPDADLIVVNQVEAEVLHSDLELPGPTDEPEALSRELLAATAPRAGLILTRGPGGATVVLRHCDEVSAAHVPALGAPATDPEHHIGAGDVMLSAVAVELISGGGGPATLGDLTLQRVVAALSTGVAVATASLDYAGTMTGALAHAARFRALMRPPVPASPEP
jgi:sugar/nucleoside kinase (ribokinase family)